jgi:hypothetical protein
MTGRGTDEPPVLCDGTGENTGGVGRPLAEPAWGPAGRYGGSGRVGSPDGAE